MRISLSERGTTEWNVAADLGHRVFCQTFGADVRADPDLFLSYFETTRDGRDELIATTGLTFPERQSLLLERYLDAPIEKAIAAHRDGRVPDRSEILQVGTIASVQITAGAELIRAMPLVMLCLGRPYGAMTMTGRLAALAKRVGSIFYSLAEADRACLSQEELTHWGTYYDQRPTVYYCVSAEQSALLAEFSVRYQFGSMNMNMNLQERVPTYA